MDESGAVPRTGALGLVVVVAVGAVGYVLLSSGEAGQLVAGGVVMFGAAVLGAVQGYRDRSPASLVGAVALLAGGGYGVALATAGRDPFTDGIVLGLVVLGLVVGLFDSPGDGEDGSDDGPE